MLRRTFLSWLGGLFGWATTHPVPMAEVEAQAPPEPEGPVFGPTIRFYASYLETDGISLLSAIWDYEGLLMIEPSVDPHHKIGVLSEDVIYSEGFLANLASLRVPDVLQFEVPFEEVEFVDGRPTWKLHPEIVLSSSIEEEPDAGPIP